MCAVLPAPTWLGARPAEPSATETHFNLLIRYVIEKLNTGYVLWAIEFLLCMYFEKKY